MSVKPTFEIFMSEMDTSFRSVASIFFESMRAEVAEFRQLTLDGQVWILACTFRCVSKQVGVPVPGTVENQPRIANKQV